MERQHVNTSEAQLEPVYAVLGSIDLDPASNPNSIVRATHHIVDVREAWPDPLPRGFEHGDGLAENWDGLRVFLQPNFDDIGPWLEKAAKSDAEIVAFVPARTHRVYFEHAWKAKVLCFPPASAFHGEKNSAPFAMVYLYYGRDILNAVSELAKYGKVIAEGITRLQVKSKDRIMSESKNEKNPKVIEVINEHRKVAIMSAIRECADLSFYDFVDSIPDQDKHLVEEVIADMSMAQMATIILSGDEDETPKRRKKRSKKGGKKVAKTRTRRKVEAKQEPDEEEEEESEEPEEEGEEEEGESEDEVEKPKKGKRKAPPRQEKTESKRGKTDDIDEAVFEVLSKSKEPMSSAELEKKCKGLSRPQIRRALARLKEAARITQDGETRSAVYSAAA